MSNFKSSSGFSLPSRSGSESNSNRSGPPQPSFRSSAAGPTRHRAGGGGGGGGFSNNPPPNRKRPLSAFHSQHSGHHSDSDSDSDGEDDSGFHGSRFKGGRHRGHEAITGFDGGKAVRAGEEEDKRQKGPLVIPSLKNKDWRAELKRKRGGENLLPEEERRRRAAGGKEEGNDVVNSAESQPSWGLTITKKVKIEAESKAEGKTENNVTSKDIELESTSGNGDAGRPIADEEEEKKTDDQLALEALLGGQSSSKKGPDLIISSASTTDTGNILRAPVEREGDAYRRAIAAAPDVSTLDDYERVPVEDFGAALLRGMGWDGKSTKAKDVQRRQNLLGLGAKSLKEAEELGGWDQKAGSKGGRGGEKKRSANDYRREKERKEKEREERYGGGYRRERERDDSRRDRDRDHGDRDRERDRYRDRR